ncbi:stealth family protein [Acinetobacter lwoffii]|uniref:Stealth CR1 domain-containing protein n=2 Tax=Gammaproteobacteria TaxID=1236 RepID=UPI00209AB1CD|nr:Stealth CR1 domain-containing protein [Acinetobacter lwoffii]MCO8114357.1 stealth family protein [Acinetobacter lwoffii]
MEKIDFVIAWVDGNDVKHRLKRQQFQSTNIVKGSAEETRFASNDEIYFSIASILKYVPYFGTIYIITDEQQPAHIHDFFEQGLCAPEQIKIIDHRTIFAGHEQYLPTFNSLSIETMLWNIPGLSKYFIYLNDDFFFNASSELDDFLVGDHIKVYGHWENNSLIKAKFNLRKGLNKYFGKPLQPKYTIAQMLSAELCGFNKYYEIHHRPHILDRDVLQNYFQKYPTTLAQQIRHRFRSAFQFLPVGLNNHLKIQANEAVLYDDINIAYLKNEALLSLFLENLNNTTIKFGCIQSLDEFSVQGATKVQQAMLSKFEDDLPVFLKQQVQVG